MRAEDVEQWRRSLAMLRPGQSAGLTREEAMALLAELHSVRAELDRLEGGLCPAKWDGDLIIGARGVS